MADRRPTKAERKEAAKREREELQRKIAKQRRSRRLGVVLASVTVVAVVAAVALWPGGLPSPKDLLADTGAAKAAGCGAIQEIGFYNGVSDPSSPDYVDQSHIGADPRFAQGPPLSSYPSTPPVSGPHAAIPPGPMPPGVYDSPPDIYRAIHSLEHAGVIIWYRPGLSGGELDDIKAFYHQKTVKEDVGQTKTLVAPYSYPGQGAAGSLPGNAQMVLVAWHKMQVCQRPSLAAAFQFSSAYNNVTPGSTYKGEAPEASSTM